MGSTVSLKYDAMFESTLNPPPTDTNSDANANAAAEDQKEEKSEIWEEKIQHNLLDTDQKEMDLALSMIDSLLKNDLSQSISLKCTNIRALIIAQKYETALSTVTNLMRWHKQNTEVMELRAIALFRNGNSDSAIKHLQQILRKDPDNKEVKKLFKFFKLIGKVKKAGNEAFKSNDLDAAIVKYSECMKMDRTNHKFNSVIYSNRAAVWLKKKEWKRAYSDASCAIDMDPQFVKAYGRRIQALYGLDRYDEAVGDAEKALRLDPSNNDLKRQLQEAKVELKKSKRKNYYKILGVEKDATEKEIKKGFRKMAMKWHPDRFASKEDDEKQAAEVKFKEIGEAYEVLKDPKLKQRYDSGVDIDHLKSGGGMGGFPGGGVDMSHIFDLLGGMQGGGMGGGHPFAHMGGGGGGQQGFTFRFG